MSPCMIEADIFSTLMPLRTYVDDLTARVTTYESRQGESSEVLALKANVAYLRKDVDYLKSTDFTSLIQTADDVEAPETLGIPPNTTRDIHREEDVVDESDTKIDKK
ncbi:uncharacterized protein LOC125877519 [Solanum stenotomum]|uniref:uncharacterized protein LOC125877519 n=1 Tax=Solanum stenotomum TaxID=172797 RepID=UPI0020D0DEF1|nr:uncharacterized protein LOC125877519 [Solanum stenotomum]